MLNGHFFTNFLKPSTKSLIIANRACQLHFQIYFSDIWDQDYLIDGMKVVDGNLFVNSVRETDDSEFPRIIINPTRLSMVPHDIWNKEQVFMLKDLVERHFRRRSTNAVKFPHKLWNVLAITKEFPSLYPILGATWISNYLIKVNKDKLANTLGLKRPKESLFNPQGTFITHGFVNVTKLEIEANQTLTNLELIRDVDGSIVRIYKHGNNKFSQDMKTKNMNKCRWKLIKKKKLRIGSNCCMAKK